jgi:hypothetical protein
MIVKEHSLSTTDDIMIRLPQLLWVSGLLSCARKKALRKWLLTGVAFCSMAELR